MNEAHSIVEDFIYSYKDWLESGAPQDEPFSRSDDLEQNLRMALNKIMKGNPVIEQACTALRELYRSTGRNDVYFPFNSNVLEWMDEVNNDRYHTNKGMIKWISSITSS